MTLTEYLTELGLYTPPPKPEPALPSFLRDCSYPGAEIKLIINGEACIEVTGTACIEVTGTLNAVDVTQSCNMFSLNSCHSFDSFDNQMNQPPIVDMNFLLKEVRVVGR